jgi:hypothetical protein
MNIFKAKSLKTVTGIFASLFLVGCGSSVPSCNDDVVQDLVLKIADRDVGFQLGAQLPLALLKAGESTEIDPSKISSRLDAIRTVDTNSKNKTIKCAASFQILYGGKTYIESPVAYTAQPTDDGKSVYVEARF